MVGTRHFNQVNQRCAMIKYKNRNDQNFGNINVLAVGDFYQLAPVMQKQLFVKDYYNSKCPQDLAPLLWDKFLFHELTQVMMKKTWLLWICLILSGYLQYERTVKLIEC